MTIRKALLYVSACILLCGSVFGQTTTSTLMGTVTDPSDALAPGVQIQITSQTTAAVRNATTDAAGLFRFADLPPGAYTMTLKATGFKAQTFKDINLSMGETRDMGKVVMAIGNVAEQIEVTAQATPVQTASSEKGGLVDGNQLIDIGLKGRDVFSFLQLLPGVLDTSDRNTISTSGDGGISANGNTTSMTNMVDGIEDRDVGAASGVDFEPNMDAVEEVKFMASNYQAEYGRNAGGVMTMVTKSGTRDFHGTGWWTHRNEGLNANTFFNNLAGKPVSIYRYNVPGWSFGGPFFIPRVWNTSKTKLFFFASQEFIRQFVPTSTQKTTMPTVLERNGDFSQSVNSAGTLINIVDPTTGAYFPGNKIPVNRLNAYGLGLLDFFPTAQYIPAVGTSDYRNYNFFEASSAPHPVSDTVVRVNVYPTSKLSGYFRETTNHDVTNSIYQGIPWAKSTTTPGAPLYQIHLNPGSGQAVSLTYVISPTTLNQFTFGHSHNEWAYYASDESLVDRSLITSSPAILSQFPAGVAKAPGTFPYMYPTKTFVNSLASTLDRDGIQNYIPVASFGGGNVPNTAVSALAAIPTRITIGWMAGSSRTTSARSWAGIVSRLASTLRGPTRLSPSTTTGWDRSASAWTGPTTPWTRAMGLRPASSPAMAGRTPRWATPTTITRPLHGRSSGPCLRISISTSRTTGA